ncbi:MAG: phosphonatase-like hydrolase [Isosphaeraceae bacterium]
MEISLVVFDIAGTTVDDADSVNVCVRAALSAAGISATREEVNNVMGLAKPEAIAKLVERAGQGDFDPARIRSIHDDFVARSIEYYQHGPGAHEVTGATLVFQTLKRAGIRIALNTGFSRAITQVILGRVGWLDRQLIDATICSDEVARGRPYPDMIRELMLRCGVADPLRVVKVGDTPADLQEGRNAGCGLVVGVTGGTHTRRELEPYPHTHLVDTIRELPGLLGLRAT